VKHAPNGFDHVRLFAALCVLYSHHFALWGRPEPGTLIGSYGGLGVAIFFALSGYLVSSSFAADPHAGRFIARRLLRIMPGLAANVLLCALLLGPLLTSLAVAAYLTHPQTHEFVLSNLAFSPRFALPGVFAQAPSGPAVNGSLWTLPFEMAAYLLLAALGTLLGPRRLRWACPLLGVVAAAVAVGWQPANPVVVWDNDLRHLPRFLTYFFVGCVLAQVDRRWLDSRWILALPVAFVLVQHDIARHLIGVVLTLSLAIHVGRHPMPERFALRHDRSYGVYLYAYPVQQWVIAKLGALGFWPTMALALLITWVCAGLSWRLIESPMLRFKPRSPVRPAELAPA
jgi:peptidoglycan/LPS O-acetylase OafA/YrhL